MVDPKKVLITGANGQLGLALQEYFPNAECVDLDSFNIADENAYNSRHWKDYELIINAAAYTNVDGAETPEGRELSWQANAHAVKLLAKTALENNITLVHVSSDYVFDGTKVPHTEDEPFSPLSVYGQSKAAGDVAGQRERGITEVGRCGRGGRPLGRADRDDAPPAVRRHH